VRDSCAGVVPSQLAGFRSCSAVVSASVALFAPVVALDVDAGHIL
jgi:hypothetical protein